MLHHLRGKSARSGITRLTLNIPCYLKTKGNLQNNWNSLSVDQSAVRAFNMAQTSIEISPQPVTFKTKTYYMSIPPPKWEIECLTPFKGKRVIHKRCAGAKKTHTNLQIQRGNMIHLISNMEDGTEIRSVTEVKTWNSFLSFFLFFLSYFPVLFYKNNIYKCNDHVH